MMGPIACLPPFAGLEVNHKDASDPLEPVVVASKSPLTPLMGT